MKSLSTGRPLLRAAAYPALAALLLLLTALPFNTCAQTARPAWTAPDSAAELTNPLEHSKRIVEAGSQIFQQLCSVCHGKGGRGDGITAAALNPKPANLTAAAVQEQSDGAIYWKIRAGRPPMPSFKSQLSEKQVWAVVTFLRTLKKEQ